MVSGQQRSAGFAQRSTSNTRLARITATVAAALPLLACPAHAQQAGYYAGQNSAGLDVEVYVEPVGGLLNVVSMGISGHEYCNGKRVPGMEAGGVDGYLVDGRTYPIIDGRVTFASFQPQFYLVTDMRFAGNEVHGTATYQEPLFLKPGAPPIRSGVASCTTGQLTFSAKFVGNESAPLQYAQRANQ